jgi:hypothetical protein
MRNITRLMERAGAIGPTCVWPQRRGRLTAHVTLLVQDFGPAPAGFFLASSLTWTLGNLTAQAGRSGATSFRHWVDPRPRSLSYGCRSPSDYGGSPGISGGGSLAGFGVGSVDGWGGSKADRQVDHASACWQDHVRGGDIGSWSGFVGPPGFADMVTSSAIRHVHREFLPHAWWLAVGSLLGDDRRKRQTFTATSAEPGDLPWGLGEVAKT